MIEFVVQSKSPEILAITPLKKGDLISKQTKDTIFLTDSSLDWISLEDNGNPYKNFDTALKLYQKHHHIPKYIIKIDNDIIAEPYMLDVMKETLDNVRGNVAYTYCGFEFTGAVEMKFPAIDFNPDRLLISNYISSISMMSSYYLDLIGGVETDDKYFRLLDWVLWLKFLKFDLKGVPCHNTSFVAYASENSISARGPEDYKKKAQCVLDDYIIPLRLSLL